MNKLINFCVFCLVMVGFQLMAQTNLAIIDSLVNENVEEIIAASKPEVKKNIIIEIKDFDNDISVYFFTIFGNILVDNGYVVYRNFPIDSTFESTVLEINSAMININYSEPYTKTIFGETFSARKVILNYTGQLYDYLSGKIILPINSEESYMDEIIYEQIEYFESSPYFFSRGTKSGITYWQNILEPVIVVSSVLTVILLIFTQRS